jgi:hypothetical protein
LPTVVPSIVNVPVLLSVQDVSRNGGEDNRIRIQGDGSRRKFIETNRCMVTLSIS